MNIVTENIRLSKDRRVWLVIFNKRQFSSYSTSTRKAWTWGPYSGKNDHSKHAHVQTSDKFNDDLTKWKIGIDMGLSNTERADIVGGNITPTNGNVLHFRLRTGMDSEDPLARETYPDWDPLGPGHKQLGESLDALHAKIDALEIRAGVVDYNLIKQAVREVLIEVLNNTKLSAF